MIGASSVLVVIPARGGSKGLPRKNILPLCGKPLVGWPVQAACNSKYVDRVIVSTDDQEIADAASALGAEVPFLRPERLAGDSATSFSVLEHALGFLESLEFKPQYVVLLEPTSPTTEASDIDTAIETLVRSREIADSIVGVAKHTGMHPAFTVEIGDTGLLKGYLDDKFASAGRRQDLRDLYYFEGSLYISDVDVLLKQKVFYHDRTLPYVVPKWKSLEVDDIVDFICIESIMNNLKRIKQVGHE